MRNDKMGKIFLSWDNNRLTSEEKARELAKLSGNNFYNQVGDSIRANGQNRRTRRVDKQRRTE